MESGYDALVEDVMEFLVEKLYRNRKDLSLKTRLSEDLRVDGDDAEKFMEQFFLRYSIDYTDFNWEVHFLDEHSPPSAFFQQLIDLIRSVFLFRPTFRDYNTFEKIPIKIEDLVFAAQTRKWKTPESP